MHVQKAKKPYGLKAKSLDSMEFNSAKSKQATNLSINYPPAVTLSDISVPVQMLLVVQ